MTSELAEMDKRTDDSVFESKEAISENDSTYKTPEYFASNESN